MVAKEHSTIYRQDYQVPAYLVNTVDLLFQLEPTRTRVTSTLTVKKNSASNDTSGSIFLNGQDLTVKKIRLDGQELVGGQFKQNDEGITIPGVSDSFTLEISTEIDPVNNTSLEGLYQSSGNFCTQCEAEGFRKITCYPDRPDVMAVFTTRIEADKEQYPVLLSNGNCLERGDLENGRHFALWHDPFPKPCYLFALVAGNLLCHEGKYITVSGKNISLEIFVEPRNIDKCEHALRSLQKAMQWDEDVFGLEYDLDTYMIVAVDDFNMGAMENKGLNVFNSKYILASQETATDQDYLGVEGVIAHEYFHNWTGNRVTCRDWFQLSLKEGLTVFRDQEFSSDMNSRAVQRIDDVRILRNFQFREDSGPMSHPVRPDSYMEINNFYTATVYNKGAEVIRMMHTLLGVENFRAGMDLYFQRHDGQAVTCDDFVAAMADASGVDLDLFKRWYRQSGTPDLEVSEQYEPEAGEYNLIVKQSCPETPGQPEKKPFHIPLALGFLGSKGQGLQVCLDGACESEFLVDIQEKKAEFCFTKCSEKPVLSFLRGFSAPVTVQPFQDSKDLTLLMGHDSDQFNRWDAANRLAQEIILALVEDIQQGRDLVLDPDFITAFKTTLLDQDGDKSLLAQALVLPAETMLAQQMDIIDPDALHQARQFVRQELARQLEKDFLKVYADKCEEQYTLSSAAIGKRSLKNVCLAYLMTKPSDAIVSITCNQIDQSTNMTDTMAALTALGNSERPERQQYLDLFHKRWQDNPLVLDKWFTLQATSQLDDTLSKVKELMQHSDFSIRNPNKVRALIGAFCSGNHVIFHQKGGEGYSFLAEQIVYLNSINPQIAARLLSPLINWKRYDEERQENMLQEINRIGETPGLSPDLYEIINKSKVA